MAPRFQLLTEMNKAVVGFTAVGLQQQIVLAFTPSLTYQ